MSDDGNHTDRSVSSSPTSDGRARPSVLVSNRQDLSVDEPSLVDLAERCLAAEGRSGAELSISFVGEEEMRELHARYLGEDALTDVLSFEQDPGGVVVGDVVICPAYAEREAARRGVALASELRLLLVHGILHLLGYDHDDDEERARMWPRQEAYSGVSAP